MPKRTLTAAELIVLIVIVSAGVLLIAAMLRFHGPSDFSRRADCASNLREIYAGLVRYADQNEGAFPTISFGRAIVGDDVSHDNLKPRRKENGFADLARLRERSVSQNLWLLVRGNYAPPMTFVCPQAKHPPQGVDLTDGENSGPEYFIDFPWKPDGRTMSYSFILPWQRFWWTNIRNPLWGRGGDPRAVLAADANNGEKPDYKGSSWPLTNDELKRYVNSRNHKGAGQNVLHGDGQVSFSPSAYAGIDHDNIYTALPWGHTGKAGDVPGELRIRSRGSVDTVLIPVEEAKLASWRSPRRGTGGRRSIRPADRRPQPSTRPTFPSG